MSEAHEIEVRDLKFAIGPDVPRYWFRGERAITLFWNSMSVFFPPGERFFIHSVKAHLEHIEDPELLKDAKAFISQEGIHTREHLRYNGMLQAQGFPAKGLERQVGERLERVKSRAPLERQLAITCALEHFTALMADLLLANARLGKGVHPAMLELWRWHAAEENEHKAVAFDVYQAAGGRYRVRAAVMLGISIGFWAMVWRHQAIMMKRDGILWSPREWLKLFSFLAFDAKLPTLLPQYLAYFKPGFHPWQHDNRELLASWREQLQLDGPAFDPS